MTYKELVLLKNVIEKVRNCKPIAISNEEIVDLDSMNDYFNNLLLDVKKQKKRGGVREGGSIAYRLLVEVK